MVFCPSQSMSMSARHHTAPLSWQTGIVFGPPSSVANFVVPGTWAQAVTLASSSCAVTAPPPLLLLDPLALLDMVPLDDALVLPGPDPPEPLLVDPAPPAPVLLPGPQPVAERSATIPKPRRCFFMS